MRAFEQRLGGGMEGSTPKDSNKPSHAPKVICENISQTGYVSFGKQDVYHSSLMSPLESHVPLTNGAD